ncbi:MAG: methionyl-tRNA formyltransferase [Coriobacteriia bacterium]
MRVVFMGTPEFAVASLRALATRHEVVCVYTRPDAASGRGRALTAPPAKSAAIESDIPVAQPTDLRGPASARDLASLAPDVVCVAAYGMILPRGVLDVPPLGCVNVHASLLPRHRGAAPVERAILAGDTTTGVSIMRMEEGLDTGPVALRVEMVIGAADAPTLTRTLATLGADALIEVLDRIEAGTDTWEPQPESGATYAARIERADVALEPGLSSEDALRRVRASGRHAPSRCSLAGVDVTVLEARTVSADLGPGRVLVTKDALILGTTDGGLALDRVVATGRAPMDGAAFARGARLDDDARWAAST